MEYNFCQPVTQHKGALLLTCIEQIDWLSKQDAGKGCSLDFVITTTAVWDTIRVHYPELFAAFAPVAATCKMIYLDKQ